MKVTDQNAIKNSEKELIDAITGDLDWGAIERLFEKKYNLQLKDDIDYKDGDIVIHNAQIAYRLNFEVKLGFSVLFDRRGECIEVEALTEAQENREENAPHDAQAGPATGAAGKGDAEEYEPAGDRVSENVSQMASRLADMISEINKD